MGSVDKHKAFPQCGCVHGGGGHSCSWRRLCGSRGTRMWELLADGSPHSPTKRIKRGCYWPVWWVYPLQLGPSFTQTIIQWCVQDHVYLLSAVIQSSQYVYTMTLHFFNENITEALVYIIKLWSTKKLIALPAWKKKTSIINTVLVSLQYYTISLPCKSYTLQSLGLRK